MTWVDGKDRGGVRDIRIGWLEYVEGRIPDIEAVNLDFKNS